MQGKSIIFVTSFIKLTTAFILLPTAFIKLATTFIKLLTAFNFSEAAFIILSTAKIKLLTANNIFASEKLLLAGAEINRKQFATAQEKAHLQSATPYATPKIAKELFPFPLLPTLKKRINFLLSIPKNQPCRIDGTAYNSSLQKWRVKCFSESFVLVESSVIFSKFGAGNPPLPQAAKRYMLCLDKHTAEKPTQKFILFLPNFFLPTLISTFCIFPNQKPMQKNAKRANFSNA